MTRVVKKITLKNPSSFAKKLLVWGASHTTFIWLDSNDYPQTYSSFSILLAVGVKTELLVKKHHNAFLKLDTYQQQTQDYIFGYLSYDLKNDTETLYSDNSDSLNFPELYFFQPQKIFILKGNSIELHYDTFCSKEMEKDIKSILVQKHFAKSTTKPLQIQQRIQKKNYYKHLKKIQEHLQKGDAYELNFCMEYYANASINPLESFISLNRISQPPFASFFRHQEQYVLSASPERFVRKEGDKLISQPIKGTIKRGKNKEEDLFLQKQLSQDPKERSENIMIVDLVRNDLSKTAQKNSVQVEELCKIYQFKQVHQLISTITSKVKKNYSPVSLIKSMYPMGSMTGAPKIAAMKIIEEQEETRRSVYSGSIGYFTPDGDFDFNVVIRSILYNEQKQYISFSVGGAITALSNPENEYQECLLKAAALKKVLEQDV